MSVEQAFEKLVKVMAGQKVTNVVVVSEPDESAVVQRLTLSDDLAQDFFRIARNATMDLGDEVQFVPYDAGYKPESHQRFYLELASYPEVDQIVNFVVQLQQAELFSEEEDVIDG